MNDRDSQYMAHFKSRAVQQMRKNVPTSVNKTGNNSVNIAKVAPKSLPRQGTIYEGLYGNPYSDQTWSHKFAHVGKTTPLDKNVSSSKKRMTYHNTFDTFDTFSNV